LVDTNGFDAGTFFDADVGLETIGAFLDACAFAGAAVLGTAGALATGSFFTAVTDFATLVAFFATVTDFVVGVLAGGNVFGFGLLATRALPAFPLCEATANLPGFVGFALATATVGFVPGFDFGAAFATAFPLGGTRPAACLGRSFAASRLAGLGLILLTFFVVFADMDVTRTQPLRA
jgi:hypothetical protein